MRDATTALFLVLWAAGAHAQTRATLVPCRGQRVDSIVIEALAPTVTGLRRVPIVGNLVRRTHVVTRHEVIRGYLLLRVGDRCTELARAESERILRAQPFLADASIDAVATPGGGVYLDVRTIDETSLILGGTLSDGAPHVSSLRIGNANLDGRAALGSVYWRHQSAFDDRLDIRLSHFQFAGKPYVFAASLVRGPLGRDDRVEVTHPFRTDLQRVAWRTLVGESRGHAAFVQRDSGRLALGFVREYAEAGGIARVGPPGRLSLMGLSLTNERAVPDTAARLIAEHGFRPDTAAGFVGRFRETSAARANLLLGVRGIRFMRARGFDALRGIQDIPIGLQVGTLVGHALPILGTNANDLFVAADVYAATGSQRVTYRLQFQGEGRRLGGSGAWDGLVASGRLARQSRITEDRTRTLSFEWSGAARVLVPHSLSLGVPDGGVRGFRDATAVGARRVVARIDEHLYLGSPFSFGDFGVAGFVDVGRLWAGDLPYGVTTPARAAIGGSLLLAVPMRSTKMWRLEWAVPLSHAPGVSRWELRLSHRDLTTFFWREPPDVNGARARAVPASVYSWP